MVLEADKQREVKLVSDTGGRGFISQLHRFFVDKAQIIVLDCILKIGYTTFAKLDGGHNG